ncbi:hypothetical protein [Sporomusa acidovorans]|uniref:Phage metallopeptidase domain-containing protein n=1 Tax=Sporomusa acidovorans (strain ATCC 49682 / DSM 3132 / Mol) TaxID=1123286 RepID=A0ABZ3J6D1_SPOA4|nr:hypothetical protein [Sporomusa acidovorans]OZC23800.1 hypothetical protein SPACI_04250 [Sporomusa acidovorans DSM 3132]SDF61548.1 hypothetical protein SAMN04488499_10635 [Sporomusa acidovorans]
MKVNILGTDYIIIEQSDDDNPKLDNANGLCEIWSKKIIINSEILKPYKMLAEQPEKFKNKVLRHEIVHAFFAESGLLDYCSDQTLVDHLSVQLPKMFKVMQQAECLD